MARTAVGLVGLHGPSAGDRADIAEVHELMAAPDTVHRGFFDATLKPVLTIDSGDVVRLHTASGNPRYYEALGVPKDKIPADLYRVFQGVEDALRWDHTLNGPIYVKDAAPGDTIEIRIRSVDVWLPLAGQSFTPNRGLLPEDFPYRRDRALFLDLDKKTVDYLPGVVLPLKPFWGVMGVAPPSAMGRVLSGPPNVFGGNMDNKDLGAGSTLYLPVHVPGALLSIGDGHAAQGHGEGVSLRDRSVLERRSAGDPAQGQAHHVAARRNADALHDDGAPHGSRRGYEDGYAEMITWMTETKGLSREDAYMLASLAMDLIVTQVVDGTKGIHALMPKSIFRR
jgi:acetamidase/formamidase